MEARTQPNFIISLSGANIDTAIVNIEEMQQYCIARKRMAIVATEKKNYGELDKLNYQLVENYVKPKILAVNTKGKNYLNVYSFLLDRYKSGLMIVESDTLSDAISDMICKSNKLEDGDIDVIICREGFASMTEGEMQKANFLRIHADPDMNATIFQKLGEFYQEKVLGLMVAQFFANDQYEEANNYFEKESNKYSKSGLTDFVDYYQQTKQLSYFVYFDVVNNKILNVSKDAIHKFLLKMKSSGIMPFPESEIPIIAESLTIE
jgi:hypothetical protein